MDINALINTYGIANVNSAIIRDVNGDRHTGSRSSWIPAASLAMDPEDLAVEIIRELPGMIFIGADGSVWQVVNA